MRLDGSQISFPVLLERFEEGAVLVHLRTGACFRLNRTAAEICGELLEGRSTEEIAAGLSARFELAKETALADVLHTQSALEDASLRQCEEEGLRYDATTTPHLVLVGEKPVLQVDIERASIALFRPESVSTIETSDAVDGVVPKLLALRGLLTVHASAVRHEGKVRAFSGRSFAGKTTTAHAFARAGCELVSEDLLLVRLCDEGPEVVLSAEARAREWALSAKRQFERNPRATIDFACLDGLATSSTSPLDTIWFLDEGRRQGESIALRRLDMPDATVAILRNLFLATMDPSDWRHALHRASAMARRLTVCEATMPEGIEALASASRRLSLALG